MKERGFTMERAVWKCGCKWDLPDVPAGAAVNQNYRNLLCPVCHADRYTGADGDESAADREAWIGGGIPFLAHGGDMADANDSVWAGVD